MPRDAGVVKIHGKDIVGLVQEGSGGDNVDNVDHQGLCGFVCVESEGEVPC